MTPEKQNTEQFTSLVKRLVYFFTTILSLIVCLFAFLYFNTTIASWFKNDDNQPSPLYVDVEKNAALENEMATFWKPVDILLISDQALKKQLEYGKELIAHTAKYLGPNGSVKKITNGMNCNNCHLDAGTKAWGNNYGSVKSMYPKLRARSGQVEDLYKRISDCMERSLNGQTLEKDSKEIKAMIAYIEFIGTNVPKGEEAKAAGIYNLEFLERAANPAKGKILYNKLCLRCHQANGQGTMNPEKTEYTYPPLWGNNSFNQGAGLYRISRFAGYIKYNMPQGATYANSLLSDEQAWDIAAYVATQPRPIKDFSQDWPDISKKPVDHPFGPFSDKFSEKQHKFGPFEPIKKAHPKK